MILKRENLPHNHHPLLHLPLQFSILPGIKSEGNKDNRVIKVYGGGITPSVFEIDYALTGKAKYWPLDFDKMQTAYYDYVNLYNNFR